MHELTDKACFGISFSMQEQTHLPVPIALKWQEEVLIHSLFDVEIYCTKKGEFELGMGQRLVKS